jgi:hypothetical protein
MGRAKPETAACLSPSYPDTRSWRAMKLSFRSTLCSKKTKTNSSAFGVNERICNRTPLFNKTNESDPSATPFYHKKLQQLVWDLGRIGVGDVAQKPWLEYREAYYDTLQSVARESPTNLVS